jgi:hypothetical protein
MVKNWAKEKGELEDNVVNFLRKKFKVPSNICEVLAPLQYANHWSVIIMNTSHFMHYDPLISRMPNLPIYKCAPFILQKCGLLLKVNYQGHLDGSEHYQRIVGCDLMDHNNYLIRNVGFMS